MKVEKAVKAVFVIYIVIAIAAFYGWVENIITLMHTGFDPLTGMAVARVVGVLAAPLGAVLGYL